MPGSTPTGRSFTSSPLAGLLLAAVIAAGAGACDRSGTAKGAYRTAKVDTGSIEVAISATGTLRALSTVDVGSQVSGQVLSVEVDFNERVTKGQVIARIDPSNLETRLKQTDADLASARASLAEAQTQLKFAEADLKRKKEIFARQLISASERDVAQAARDQAVARVAVAQSAIKQRAAVVDDAQLDVDYTVLRSPVDGVVLLRSVEPGQTVAASFQSPVLFRIAEDLTRMQIDLSIDESDVGQIKVGLPVRFTVDAFPGRTFNGSVHQVRLSATIVANVVTYPVVVEVSNPDLALLPGMTANGEIEITRRNDVVRVPNAALRFKPEDAPAPAAGGWRAGGGNGAMEEIPRIAARLDLNPQQQAALDAALSAMRERAESRRQGSPAGGGEQAGGRNPGGGQNGPPGGGAGRGGDPNAMRERMQRMFKEAFASFRESLDDAQGRLWDEEMQRLASARRVTVYTLEDGKPKAQTVRAGVSDSTHTEVVGGGLEPGADVVIGMESTAP